jgi:hypothetical protein
MESKTIDCESHGTAFSTYICGHLAINPRQTWYSRARTEDNQWPDSWCSICHEAYLKQGEWNDNNEVDLDIRLFCNFYYQSHRAQGIGIEISDDASPGVSDKC